MGIKEGIPVVAAGHDTQFAVFGSGASINEPVLSSGTWEILMVRAKGETVSLPSQKEGVTIELDAESGLIDLGVQWVASGVLEWVSKLFYPDLQKNPDIYAIMIDEARHIEAGSKGVTVIPELFQGGFVNGKGTISGLQHDTTSAHIYRATLEALSYYSRHGLDMIQKAGNFKAESVIVVGGGAKNMLWTPNQGRRIGYTCKSHRPKRNYRDRRRLVCNACCRTIFVYPGSIPKCSMQQLYIRTGIRKRYLSAAFSKLSDSF